TRPARPGPRRRRRAASAVAAAAGTARSRRRLRPERAGAAPAPAAGPEAGLPARATRGRAADEPPPRRRGPRDRGSPRTGSLDVLPQDLRQLRERCAGPGLDRPQRDAEELCDLALREAAPVRERQHLALSLRQLFQRAVDAPGDPALLGALAGAWVGRRLVRDVRRHVTPRARPVDDRVPGDRVEPGRAGPAV